MGGLTTVVIPVWDDYVLWLPEAIESVLTTAPGTRVIVVDNASRDSVKVEPPVTLVRAPGRLSVGAARNLGLARVETPYVMVLDADDRVLPGAVAFLEEKLDSDPALVVATTSILDGQTGIRHRSPRRFVHRLCGFPRVFAVANMIWSLYPIQGCALMRTRIAQGAGGYPDTDWGDDWALAVSMASHGRVAVSPRLGRYYRHHEGSLARRPRHAAELAASAARIRARLRKDPATPALIRASLPLLAVAQLSAVYILRPVYLAVQRGRI